MNVVKPKIISFNELKSIKNISKICKKSDVPIMITGGEFDDVVFMNIDYYEKILAKIRAAILINESLMNARKEEQKVDGNSFLNELESKYTK